MKRFLSVICMALLAGGMIFTSCTKNWTVTVNTNNKDWGTVTGGGTYADGATATITATPAQGYKFVQWNDGVKDNPRTITVTANVTFTAEFVEVPAGPAVKVTFNNEVWDASSISGRYFTSYDVWDVYSAKTENDFPISDVATGILTGSQSTTASSDNGQLDGDFQWVEYYKETYLQDNQGQYYGDFWAKNVTCNVTAFDATALTLTSNVSGTMFSAKEAFVDGVGVDDATTAPMTVNITNVKLTSAKNMPSKKVAGKLVAVK